MFHCFPCFSAFHSFRCSPWRAGSHQTTEVFKERQRTGPSSESKERAHSESKGKEKLPCYFQVKDDLLLAQKVPKSQFGLSSGSKLTHCSKLNLLTGRDLFPADAGLYPVPCLSTPALGLRKGFPEPRYVGGAPVNTGSYLHVIS